MAESIMLDTAKDFAVWQILLTIRLCDSCGRNIGGVKYGIV